MSVSSWKKEFYPTPARRIKTELGAARHDLKKWRGALEENLRKHNVTLVTPGYIQDENGNEFSFDNETCASCCLSGQNCRRKCDLYKIRDFTPCTLKRDDETENPWYQLLYHNNPRPMIRWLEKLVKKLESKDATDGQGGP